MPEIVGDVDVEAPQHMNAGLTSEKKIFQCCSQF